MKSLSTPVTITYAQALDIDNTILDALHELLNAEAYGAGNFADLRERLRDAQQVLDEAMPAPDDGPA